MRRRGYSLFEMLLCLGVVLVITAAIFTFYRRTDNSQANRQANYAVVLLDTIVRTSGVPLGHYGPRVNAHGVVQTVQQAIVADELAPPDLVENGQLRSRWGPIEIEPMTVAGRLNAGFRLTYRSVPANLCLAFVQQLPRGERALLVGGIKVNDQGKLDGPLVAQQCDASSTTDVVLEHYSGEAGA